MKSNEIEFVGTRLEFVGKKRRWCSFCDQEKKNKKGKDIKNYQVYFNLNF